MFRLPDTPCNKHKKRKKRKKGQKHHRNPVILAREWKESIERGEYASQADLARKKGVSRARVTQILNLLKLNPEVQETVIRLGDPVALGSITEKRLRGLSSRSASQQRKKLRILLSGRLPDSS